MTAFTLTVLLLVMVPLVTSNEGKLQEEDRLREGELQGYITDRATSEDIHGVSYKRAITERWKQNSVALVMVLLLLLKKIIFNQSKDIRGGGKMLEVSNKRAITEDIRGGGKMLDVPNKRSITENERGERDAMRRKAEYTLRGQRKNP